MKPTRKRITRGAEAARQPAPAILVATGETTVIARHGHEIAAVAAATSIEMEKQESLLEPAGSGRALWGESSSKTLADLRDEWSP